MNKLLKLSTAKKTAKRTAKKATQPFDKANNGRNKRCDGGNIKILPILAE